MQGHRGRLKPQGCTGSIKQLPRGEARPPNADIIRRAADPREWLGSGGRRRAAVNRQPPAAQADRPAQTRPFLLRLMLGGAGPTGVTWHGRSTLGSHGPFTCLFLWPSAPSSPGLLGVTASGQRTEYSCLVPGTSRSRPERCLRENNPGVGEGNPQTHTSKAAGRPEAHASPTLPEPLRPLWVVSTLGQPSLQAFGTSAMPTHPHTPPGPNPHSPYAPSHEGSETKTPQPHPLAPGRSHWHWHCQPPAH